MKTDLVWHTETRKIKDLKDHPKNPRQITKAQMEKIKESIDDFNYVEIVAINLDNTILAGHMRTRAMKALGRGKEEIEVRVPSRILTEKEAEKYLIVSNKNTGEWDYDILCSHWEEEELLQYGFTEEDFGKFVNEEDIEEQDVSLPNSEAPLKQMTFTLSHEQAEAVERALKIAKALGDFVDTGNENSNGNALGRIAEMWISSHE